MKQRPVNQEATPLTFNKLKISYSRKCNAACDHCSVRGGPRQRGNLGRSEVFTCIEEAAKFGFLTIEFTGGEITLFLDDLLDFMTCSSDHGMGVVINTNAFWATTRDAACRRIEKLKRHGLRQIVLSTDYYHQKFIPLTRIVNALEAARELDILAGVTICHLQGDSSVMETIAALHRHTSTMLFQSVMPFGRGAELPRENMVRYSYSRSGLPCKAVVNPAIGPDGRVTLCCAPPLYLPTEIAQVSPLILGWLDREPLTEILQRAQQDRFLNLLAAEGMAGIVERINELEPGLYRPRSEPDAYFGLCDICLEILGSEPFLTRVRPLIPAIVRESAAAS